MLNTEQISKYETRIVVEETNSLRPKNISTWSIVRTFIIVLFFIVNLGCQPDNSGISPASTSNTPPEGEFEAGYTWIRSVDGMEMVYVPGGEFEMGSESGDDEESPVHTVELDAFWIDRTEVTNAQFTKCVQAGQCEAPTCDLGDPTYGDPEMLEHPVVCVDWNEAQAYCEWVGGELPTEAEWEYAAGGPENLVYPWGNELREKYANCVEIACKDGYAGTSPVGSFPEGASWCKTLDMTGNVLEWVADWFGEYPSERQVNPVGPNSGTYRVLRGGSWSEYGKVKDLRCASRSRLYPSYALNIQGFRCVAGSSRGK